MMFFPFITLGIFLTHKAVGTSFSFLLELPSKPETKIHRGSIIYHTPEHFPTFSRDYLKKKQDSKSTVLFKEKRIICSMIDQLLI